MIIGMTVITNVDISQIDTLVFELKTGSKLEVDRKATDYEIKDVKEHKYFIQFHDVYLWSLDGHHIFGDEGCIMGNDLDYRVDEFDYLTRGANITPTLAAEYELNLDDNDEEVYFDVISFSVY